MYNDFYAHIRAGYTGRGEEFFHCIDAMDLSHCSEHVLDVVIHTHTGSQESLRKIK